MLQDVHDEALLDSLLHRVAVEGAMGDLAMGLGIGVPEELGQGANPPVSRYES